MGVEWHPVENSKLASAGAMPDHNYAFNHWIHELFQAGMVSSSSGIEECLLTRSLFRLLILAV
jgi:hypothetical protein